MAIETHIQQLEEKHKELDSVLGQMLNQPSACDVEIADVKRQKLQIKDRISRLRTDDGLN
ncbi:MAG: DUF465 domain-containing protein [Rhizobiaceae bacterium]|nr:DUF465 domain-containing protein [Rhizobiaceae bacterium]